MSDEIIWKGPDDLRPLLVPIDQLGEDRANANVHDERSIAGIAASYRQFGQQKPVVSNGQLVVYAGNGQLKAAAERLGWTHLAVVRSDLIGADLRGYAIADNRTAEHARRDEEILAAHLKELQSIPDYPVEATGYTDAEVDSLLEKLAADHAGDDDSGDAEDELPPERWMVVVECRDEQQQVALLAEFEAQGLTCRAVMS